MMGRDFHRPGKAATPHDSPTVAQRERDEQGKGGSGPKSRGRPSGTLVESGGSNVEHIQDSRVGVRRNLCVVHQSTKYSCANSHREVCTSAHGILGSWSEIGHEAPNLLDKTTDFHPFRHETWLLEEPKTRLGGSFPVWHEACEGVFTDASQE